MTDSRAVEDRPHATPTRLSGTLGSTAIVFMVVAAAAPLTIIGGVAPIGFLLGNGAGFPALYIVAAVVLVFFAVGLSAMSRYIPRPGAFFTYIGNGLSRGWGLGAAFLAIITYLGVQLAVFAFIGAIVQSTLVSLGGPDIVWWVWSLIAVAVVGVLGFRRIGLSSKVLAVLLVAEVGIILLLDIAIIVQGGAAGLSLEPFTPQAIFSGNLGVGLMFAVAGFVGFEATAIFRDEAREPARTIPRATYTAVVGIGLFYALSSWAIVMAWGVDDIVAVAGEDPEGLLFATTERYLGPVAGVAVQVLLITSLLACVISFHNVVARYFHALGSAGALPVSLGRRHGAHGSPHIASVSQTVLIVLILAAMILLGLDPVLEIFTWLSGSTTLGALVLMALTCIAVIVYFRRTRVDRRAWQTVIAPSLGMIGLAVILAVVIANLPTLVGGSVAVALVIGAVIVVCLVAGLVVAGVLRTRRPAAYAKLIESIAP
jgi:amino acid transporter